MFFLSLFLRPPCIVVQIVPSSLGISRSQSLRSYYSHLYFFVSQWCIFIYILCFPLEYITYWQIFPWYIFPKTFFVRKKPCHTIIPLYQKIRCHYLLAWFNIIITLFREILYGIYFNIRCIFWYFPWILNLRPLKAKLGELQVFGSFWNFLAIFAFLAELDNSKHFEP